jgi:hypothetical protein
VKKEDQHSDNNDIETKVERSFDLVFVFDIKTKEAAYSRTCKIRKVEANSVYSTNSKVQSGANSVYSTKLERVKSALFIPQIQKIKAEQTLFNPQIRKIEGKRSLFIPQILKIEAKRTRLIPEIGKIEAKKRNWIEVHHRSLCYGAEESIPSNPFP